MAKLILIKHSLPTIDPTMPAATWPLADEGLQRCARLAHLLHGFLPTMLFSSPEPKAQTTAAILARAWSLSFSAIPGLEEHHRHHTPFLTDTDFQQRVQEFFAHPSRLVFGEETADAAYTRFATALDTLLAQHTKQTLMIVTHGTVISLYLSRRAGVDPFALWSQLGLPSFIILDHTTLEIETQQLQIEPGVDAM